MGKYIDQGDLEDRLGASTVAQLFADDFTNGAVNVNAIAATINDAEGEVDGFLLGVIDIESINGADRLLRLSALDFAESFAFKRHPEYVRTFGEGPREQGLYSRAKGRMERIRSAAQRLPDQPAAAKPRNVGGIVVDSGPRTITTGADGTMNGDGF